MEKAANDILRMPARRAVLLVMLGMSIIALAVVYIMPDAGKHDIAVKPGHNAGEEGKASLGVQYEPAAAARVFEAESNLALRPIRLVSRGISLDELTQLAPFTVLWPQDLPEGYRLSGIMEMSESWTESSGSGIFILEFTSDRGVLHIWQYLKSVQSLPSVSGKQAVATLRLADGTQLPVYEAEEGTGRRAFLAREPLNIEISFRNLPLQDVEDILSSLAASQAN